MVAKPFPTFYARKEKRILQRIRLKRDEIDDVITCTTTNRGLLVYGNWRGYYLYGVFFRKMDHS